MSAFQYLADRGAPTQRSGVIVALPRAAASVATLICMLVAALGF